MIELAPNHKSGLPVINPILLAGCMIGYGDALHTGVATAQLGGVVVGPVRLQGRGGAALPRLAGLPGGFVLEPGVQSRGVYAVVRQYAALWARLGCPVIAQLADEEPDALGKVAERLNGVDALSGLELLLPRRAEPEHVRRMVRAVTHDNDLPVWVKPSLESAVTLAPAAVEAGAVGVVVGQPPLGAARPKGCSETSITGLLFGPLSFAVMLPRLLEVAQLGLGCALIACGGIYTAGQAQQALAAGAHAVQIDAAVWVEPGLPARLAHQWANSQSPQSQAW